MGAWHACAKLRIHTDSTLAFLKQATRDLGICLRTFSKKVCHEYQTHELPSETASRVRRRANEAKRGKETQQDVPKGTRIKSFNLNTFKIYSMGHYCGDIQRFGTIDNYTTMHVCLGISFKLTFFLTTVKYKGEAEHKEVKKLYGRTNKRKNFVSQVTVHYRRKQVLARIALSTKAQSKKFGSPGRSKDVTQQRQTSPCIPINDRDALPHMRPHEHHCISSSDKVHENIIRFAHKNPGDPATQVICHAAFI